MVQDEPVCVTYTDAVEVQPFLYRCRSRAYREGEAIGPGILARSPSGILQNEYAAERK